MDFPKAAMRRGDDIIKVADRIGMRETHDSSVNEDQKTAKMNALDRLTDGK